MSVGSFNITYYVCKCDVCGRVSNAIQKDKTIYNGAQAARSIGWSFGKDGKTLCPECRLNNWNDRHIDHFSVVPLSTFLENK